MGERNGRTALILAGGMAAGVFVFWLVFGGRGETSPARTSNPHADPGRQERPPLDVAREPAIPPARARPDVPNPDVAPEEAEGATTMDGFVPAPDSDATAAAWAAVDLEEVRKALPNNLYFDLSAPTRDPDVLAERQAERDRSNVEYGKVLSGTGTDEEIRDYYDQRARLSTDYVELTTYLLDHYIDDLPERDVGLLQLARRLHLARLEEIPRKVEEALERKRQQDAVREAWLADEAAFGAADHDDAGDE
jgi:hypothetical protein